MSLSKLKKNDFSAEDILEQDVYGAYVDYSPEEMANIIDKILSDCESVPLFVPPEYTKEYMVSKLETIYEQLLIAIYKEGLGIDDIGTFLETERKRTLDMFFSFHPKSAKDKFLNSQKFKFNPHEIDKNLINHTKSVTEKIIGHPLSYYSNCPTAFHPFIFDWMLFKPLADKYQDDLPALLLLCKRICNGLYEQHKNEQVFINTDNPKAPNLHLTLSNILYPLGIDYICLSAMKMVIIKANRIITDLSGKQQ